MSYRMTDIMRLREASQRCHARAEASDDGLSALSYAQLADEIDGMLVVREANLAADRALRWFGATGFGATGDGGDADPDTFVVVVVDPARAASELARMRYVPADGTARLGEPGRQMT